MEETPQTRGLRFGPIARLPIGVKLPLVAGLLVLVVTVAMGYAAYDASRRAMIDSAAHRQAQVASTFADIMDRGAATVYRNQTAAAAARPALQAYLQSPGQADRYQALDALEFSTPSRGQDTQVVAVELVSASGSVVLATGRGTSITGALAGRADLPRPTPTDTALLGRLRVVGDTILFPVVARLTGGEPTGYVVMWRRVLKSDDTRDLLGKLIGTNGAMLVGNSDGSVWHNIGEAVDGPALAEVGDDSVVSYRRAGRSGELLGRMSQLKSAPWAVMVEFPVDTILAPITGFTQRLAVIAAICLGLALVLTWFLSRRITLPLARLTVAADSISSGDGRHRISMPRDDELGILANSFDRMAAQVAEARQRLEERVVERTEELNEALQQLEEAQEALVRREKLATLGQLASSVGHELRNPLGVMSNAVYYLEMVLDTAPANVKEYLGILREQVKVSGKIINDLLDFSRISTAHRQPVSLRELMEAQLGQVVIPTRVTVEFNIPENLPHAMVDPVHAGQVMMNLVTNAVQAMGAEGGTLRIEGHGNGEGKVSLLVHDSGPGIAPENQARIFEPLFTTKARGIGLGLAVSRSLANVNDGDLTCRSEPGAGASFIFTLPVAEAP